MVVVVVVGGGGSDKKKNFAWYFKKWFSEDLNKRVAIFLKNPHRSLLFSMKRAGGEKLNTTLVHQKIDSTVFLGVWV